MKFMVMFIQYVNDLQTDFKICVLLQLTSRNGKANYCQNDVVCSTLKPHGMPRYFINIYQKLHIYAITHYGKK